MANDTRRAAKAERAQPLPCEGVALRSPASGAQPQPVELRPIETLLARIHETLHPVQVWLFGSRARGDARPTSDWDLLVVVPDDIEESQLDPLTTWRRHRGLGIHADVIPIRMSEFRDDLGTPNTLAYAVGLEGVLIYER